MKPSELIGYALLNTTAVTAIVSANVWAGLRPKTSSVPSITFYPITTIKNSGVETHIFSINCRNTTPDNTDTLAREVIDLFSGSSYRGKYGVLNNFDVARCGISVENGLIFEQNEGVFNIPIDIFLVNTQNTVS